VICSVPLVPGFYITPHYLQACSSVERAPLEVESSSTPGYTVTLWQLPLSSIVVKATVTPGSNGCLTSKRNAKLHFFCQCGRADIQPWKWTPISKTCNKKKLASMSLWSDAKYVNVFVPYLLVVLCVWSQYLYLSVCRKVCVYIWYSVLGSET